MKLRAIFHLADVIRTKDTIKNIPNCDVLLMCHDANRGDYYNDLPYSKLIDSVHEELVEKGLRCVQFSHPYSINVGGKAWANPFSANRRFLVGQLLRYVSQFVPLKSARRIFNTEKYSREGIYAYIINKATPKFILTIGSPPALCRVARKEGVPVVELLHGIGFPPGKWGWSEAIEEHIPTHILSLDKISTRSFSNLKEKGVLIMEIPHPWYKRFKGNIKRKLVDDKWLEKPDFIPSGKKVILLSLNWGYDGDHGEKSHLANVLPNGLIPEAVIRAIKLTKDEVFWCLRRHPVHLGKKYNYQIDFLNNLVDTYNNCEWIESTKRTLISLTSVADGHITMSSMTSYDAALMGVKSLLLCPCLNKGSVNEKDFNDLVEAGYAKKGQYDESKIIEWTRSVKKTHPFSISDADENDWKIVLDELLRTNK